MSSLNNRTPNPSSATPARSWSQSFTHAFRIPLSFWDTLIQFDDRLEESDRPAVRQALIGAWLIFSILPCIYIINYGALVGAKGWVKWLILAGVLDIVFQIEERLPRWLQPVWRRLLMLAWFCFSIVVTQLVILVALGVATSFFLFWMVLNGEMSMDMDGNWEYLGNRTNTA